MGGVSEVKSSVCIVVLSPVCRTWKDPSAEMEYSVYNYVSLVYNHLKVQIIVFSLP